MARPTQRTLAKRLGISQSTVSAVLNNNSTIKISQKTCDKILQAAQQENYWPNRLANALLVRKTKAIGIVYRCGHQQTIIDKLFAVTSAIDSAGYFPLAHNLVSDRSSEYTCQFLRDINVDGILLLNVLNSDFLEQAYPKYLKGIVPTVAVDIPDSIGFAQFNSDRRQGFRLVAEHLLGLGYRKLAVLATALPPAIEEHPYWHTYGAVHGVGDALEAMGLNPPFIEYHQPSMADRYNAHLGGEVTMERLLDAGEHPDAVICMNDAWAIGAIAACAKRGIRVPEDLAITGFQNEIQGQYSLVPLTSVKPPVQTLTQTAVDTLISHLETHEKGSAPADASRRTLFACELVVRQSCGAQLLQQ